MKKLSPWMIWIPAEFFTLYQFLIQLTGGVIVEPLMKDFSVSAVGAAVLISSFYYIYISLQIPVGIIMDKVGPRRLLTMGALVCGMGCILFAHTTNFYVALFSRLLMGGGAAFSFVGTLYIIREWFPVNRYAFLVGMSEMLGMFWAVLGTIVFAMFFHTYGWRICMFGSGVFFILSGVGCAFLVRNNNPDRSAIRTNKGITLTMKQRLFLVMRSPVMWCNGIYSGLMFSVVTVFVALWGTPFLQLILHVSLAKAAVVGTSAYIGIALGCPLYGYLSQKYGYRRPFLIFSGISTALLLTFMLYVPLALWQTRILMFLIGLCCSGYILCFAISDDFSFNKMKNTSTGFTNAICMITAPLLQPIVGYILDWRSPLGHYTLLDYQYGLSLVVIALLLGVVFAWIMPETFKRHK